MTLARLSTCLLLGAGVLLAPIAAHATDDRLVSRPYDENAVVRIDGRLGVQATIGFGEKESIENVAVGDSASWQITPNKRGDLLFIKPLAPSARTNMTVVTDKHTYFFDLVGGPQAKPLYMLRFSYREEAKSGAAAAGAPAAPAQVLGEAERAVITGDPVTRPVDQAAVNLDWRRKGEVTLQPFRIYDDGQATFLLWGPGQKIPAILVLNDKGEEGPVNYAVRGNTIVISEVPAKIVLRLGQKSATLENIGSASPRPAGSADKAGATLSLAATSPVPNSAAH